MIAAPDYSISFDSIDQAVAAVIRPVFKYAKDWEYGGVVFERDGRYYVSMPVTSYQPYTVSYMIEGGVKVVAIWHTHPCGSGMPSKDDIETASRLGVPSYIGVMCSKMIARMNAAYKLK